VLSGDIDGTFQLLTINTFKGQFPCFDPNLNGTRKLLVFDLILNNTGFEEIRLSADTYPVFYSVMMGVTQMASGNITVPWLRDTSCYDNGTMKFYNGHLEFPTTGINFHCLFKVRAGALCIWIDVSALILQTYDVILSLEEIPNPLDPPPDAVVSVVNLLTIPRLVFGGSAEAVLLIVLSSIVILFIGLYPCVRYEMNKPKRKSYVKSKTK
jgi:hypothetical protein